MSFMHKYILLLTFWRKESGNWITENNGLVYPYQLSRLNFLAKIKQCPYYQVAVEIDFSGDQNTKKSIFYSWGTGVILGVLSIEEIFGRYWTNRLTKAWQKHCSRIVTNCRTVCCWQHLAAHFCAKNCSNTRLQADESEHIRSPKRWNVNPPPLFPWVRDSTEYLYGFRWIIIG